MDQNFDGRISYNEMRTHFENLGFTLQELEGTGGAKVEGSKSVVQKSIKEHRWRDKALELIIRTIKSRVKDKSIT